MALEAPSSAELGQLFELRQRDAQRIERFVSAHPFLNPLLIEAHTRLKHYFGDSEQALELITDPDEEQASSHLVIYIRTDKSPGAALETLKRFDRDWFLDTIEHAQGKLSVDVEILRWGLSVEEGRDTLNNLGHFRGGD